MSSQRDEDSESSVYRSLRNIALPDLKPTQLIVKEVDTSTQSAQASIESKYSTLHTCGAKVLPCEEDGVVVVL